MNPTEESSMPKAATMTVNGKQVTLAEARKLLGISDEDCVGCVLGDASPETHDYGFGCEWGDGAPDLD